MERIAGTDVSYDGERYFASLVVCEAERVVSIRRDQGISTTPYVSGFFFLKEAPIIARLIEDEPMDLLFVNGHGLCHPYGFGLATVVGIARRLPTVGVARRLMRGDYGNEPTKAADVRLVTRGQEVVGASVSCGRGRKPVIVSVGHALSLAESVEAYLRWRRQGGLPEPLRLAHLEARAALRAARKEGESHGREA